MNNVRFLKIALVIMVLINIVTIGYLWIGRPGGGMQAHDAGDNRGPFRFLCDKLQLDPKQVSTYEELRNEHHNAVVKYQEHSHQLRDLYFALMQSLPIDSMKVKQYADSIAADQKQIELLTFYHFTKLRAICNPEQQKIFDNVIGDALKMMSGPPHPPQPPR